MRLYNYYFMQPITLLTIGSLKTSWIKEGCADYQARIERSCQFEVNEIPASKQKDEVKQREEESVAILTRLEKCRGLVWVLDETGKQFTSQQFADEIEKLSDLGTSITFVLGGAYGHTDEVRHRADRVFALSKMTFPHELCRFVFLEQLYRAQEIRRGSGYHHA